MKAHYSHSRYVTYIRNPKDPNWPVVVSWTTFMIGISGSLVTISLLAYLGSQLVVNTSTQIATFCFFSLAFNIISAILFVTAAWRFRSNTQSRLKYPTLILSLINLVLTLACGIWIQVVTQSEPLPNNIIAVDAGLIVIAILSTIFQVVLLLVLAIYQPQEATYQHESIPEINITSRPATSKTQHTAHSNPFSSRSGSTSPQLSISAISIRSFPSRKNSNTHSRLSDVSQLDFHWDTSGVPAILRDTVQRNISSKLPPIPGSRPVSPAKALDGPFLPPSPHPNQSQPNSPIESSFSPNISAKWSRLDEVDLLPPQPQFAESFDQSSSTTTTTTTTATAKTSSSTPKQISRCSSAISLVESVSHLNPKTGSEEVEAHIHPLFRSNSPTPVPFASKRTIVTAASVLEAEEIVSNNRTRPPSRSKPTSPLTRNREWTFINTESTNSSFISSSSLSSQQEQQDEEQSMSSTSDIIVLPSLPRSSTTSRPRASIESWGTQLTQPSTPTKHNYTSPNSPRNRSNENSPIPGFVLAAGNRNSMLDFEARLGNQNLPSPKKGLLEDNCET